MAKEGCRLRSNRCERAILGRSTAISKTWKYCSHPKQRDSEQRDTSNSSYSESNGRGAKATMLQFLSTRMGSFPIPRTRQFSIDTQSAHRLTRCTNQETDISNDEDGVGSTKEERTECKTKNKNGGEKDSRTKNKKHEARDKRTSSKEEHDKGTEKHKPKRRQTQTDSQKDRQTGDRREGLPHKSFHSCRSENGGIGITSDKTTTISIDFASQNQSLDPQRHV